MTEGSVGDAGMSGGYPIILACLRGWTFAQNAEKQLNLLLNLLGHPETAKLEQFSIGARQVKALWPGHLRKFPGSLAS